MTPSFQATPDPCLLIGRRSLRQLRTILERESGGRAASVLREAGFASGEAIFQALTDYAGKHYGVERPQALDAARLATALDEFFTASHWGHLALGEEAPGILALDSPDWAEATDGVAPFPSCHFTAGLLADLFTRLAGRQAAVMEVECRSRGDGRCRFLVGGPGTLTALHQRMAKSGGW